MYISCTYTHCTCKLFSLWKAAWLCASSHYRRYLYTPSPPLLLHMLRLCSIIEPPLTRPNPTSNPNHPIPSSSSSSPPPTYPPTHISTHIYTSPLGSCIHTTLKDGQRGLLHAGYICCAPAVFVWEVVRLWLNTSLRESNNNKEWTLATGKGWRGGLTGGGGEGIHRMSNTDL